MTSTGKNGRTTPLLVSTPADLRAATAALLERTSGPGNTDHPPSLGLVPTMGGLHEGHAVLARTAREVNDVVVVSIFVNPLQFGDQADLDRYPRTLPEDLELLGGCGVDIVFAPSVDAMYPKGEPLVRLTAGRLGAVFEGAARPGHFDGMLTVVSKLLHLGMPSTNARYRAYFGEKDAQQLAIIRRMVLDLNIPVAIEGVAIVRDDDGLALSSRNRFLGAEERRGALVLSRVLHGLAEDVRSGCTPDLDAARAAVAAEAGVDLDYLEAVDPASFAPVAEGALTAAPVLVVVAARVGAVRLIDNVLLPAVG